MKLELYDLHCHSTCSDGSNSPIQLIDIAKEKNLQGIAITDHDTVAAYTDSLFEYASLSKVDLITGVEFSTKYDKQDGYESIHILGYNIDCKNKKLMDFCTQHKQRRIHRFNQIVEKLELSGYNIKEELKDVKRNPSIGRPHIAKVLIKKGYVDSMEMAFKKFIGDKAPFFIPSDLPSIEETIAVIKIAGGKAILAHPILIKGRKVLRRLLSIYQFDGMECFYGNFSRNKIQYLIDICNDRNILITGGSDYHGDHKKFVTLGSSFTTQEDLRKLL